jgi:hypothetical protein
MRECTHCRRPDASWALARSFWARAFWPATLLLMTGLLQLPAPAYGFEAVDDQFPYSIMTPEPGTRTRHHAPAPVTELPPAPPPPSLLGREKFVGKLHRPPGLFVAHGSSGTVLPTPLPRTQLIPPVGGSALVTPNSPLEQGRTVVPGLSRTIPNLPHGAESFQDRASRCSFQSSLYGVPGGAKNLYMSTCVQ